MRRSRRDDPPCVQSEDRENGALLLPADLERAAAATHFEASEQPKAQVVCRRPRPPRLLDAAQRRESLVQARRHELVEAHRPVEVLDQVVAQIREREVGNEHLDVLDHRLGRLRQHDLPAVRRRRDASGPVHRDAAVRIGEVHLSRVDPHPNLDRRVLGPRLGGQGALSLDRRGDGIARAGKHDEEAVTGCVRPRCPP